MEQTIQIETGQSIKFDHVASFRKKIKQSEVDNELGKFVAILQGSGARRNGPMISATFGVENDQEEPILDIEFMFPIDRPIDLPEPYKFKPVFQLVDAIYTRYAGNPQGLDRVFMELMNYINQNQLIQVSAGYKISTQPPTGSEACFDVYIAVNQSIL